MNAPSANFRVLQDPFPHCVVDGLWDEGLIEAVRAEFPEEDDQRWIRYGDAEHEEKLEGPEPMFGPATRTFVEVIASLAPAVSAAFGTEDLLLSTEGGGYHQTNPGGGLAVHADFNRSDSGLFRRINVITYLNRSDEPVNGGNLQLWDANGPSKAVEPRFNRTLLFETSDHSFHGHPEPLGAPNPRRSFAAYFFSEEPPAHYVEDHSTVWHPKGKRTQ